jgi:hypothetical protein
MGGGYSSVSKIMVISPSTRKDVDINYLFGQVDIKTATVVRFKNILLRNMDIRAFYYITYSILRCQKCFFVGISRDIFQRIHQQICLKTYFSRNITKL